MKNIEEIEKMVLAGTKNGVIRVGVLHEPYGAKSASVATVAISLQKDASEPDWKVHIPLENIDGVIEALQKAKALM
ncbi:MAG: hypothetical protein IE881_00195 [Epsilonproteobacteria bacterium]|nr:hypothetical protein [Campylobacterota bacterium]